MLTAQFEVNDPNTTVAPMPLDAIIFDVDGTLAETEETHRIAFNQAFAERLARGDAPYASPQSLL